MIKLMSLLKEETLNELIEKIKVHLYTLEDYNSWNEFVDRQEQGNCQTIVAEIIRMFPQAKKVFGEIERDVPYKDENGEEQILQTHHWIVVNNIYLDFSKGTLKNVIEFVDLYKPDLKNDEWRYHKL